VVEAYRVQLPLSAPRWGMTLAALACLVLRPSIARAQAEELPPESAGEQSATAPAQASPPLTPPVASPSQPQPQAITTLEHRSRWLFMPYLGLNQPVGGGWASFKPGWRIGALLGWRITERASINVECDVESERPDAGKARQELDSGKNGDEDFWSGFWSPPIRTIDLAASPLVEFWHGQIRLGPKIGWFTSSDSETGATATAKGFLFGLNAGLFVPYGAVTVVGMVNLNFRKFTSTDCSGCLYPTEAHHTMGLSGGVLL